MNDDDYIKQELEKASNSGRKFKIHVSGANQTILLYTISRLLEVNGSIFKFLDKNGKEVICRYDSVKQIEYI